MKRILSLATVVLVLFSLAAFAGDKQGKAMSVDEKVAKLAQDLNLTADQQARIKPVLEEQQAQIKAVWDDASLSDDVKKARKTEIKKATHQKLQAILTPEQNQKLEAMHSQYKKTTAKQ